MNATGGDGGDSSVPIASSDAPAISGMTEATIRQTIAHLEALLPERTLTIRELWDRHQQTLPNVPWVTSMQSTMKRFLARCGHMLVARFTPTDWEDYRDSAEIKGHYSVTTRNIHLRRLKAALNWAVNTDRIPFNPIARVRKEKGKAKRETEITHDGEAAVLGYADPMMQAGVLIAVDSGLRRNEVRQIEWSDIDFAAQTVVLHAIRTKTKRRRVVRLTPRAMAAIKALPRWPGCPYVFANPTTKKPIAETTFWRKWRRAADGARLKPAPGDGSVRFHDLRHECASRLASLGAPVPAIQKILGHESMASTLLYIRVNPRDVEAAYQLLVNSQRKGPQRSPTRGVGIQSTQRASKNRNAG